MNILIYPYFYFSIDKKIIYVKIVLKGVCYGKWIWGWYITKRENFIIH